MNLKLKNLLSRYQAPAGDDGADTGGADTGPASTAVLDDDAYFSLSEEERARLRGDQIGGEAALTPATPAPTAAPAPSTDTGATTGVSTGAAAAPESDPDDTGAEKGGGIPRARFNEINDRRKALEAENEALRAQIGGRGTQTAPVVTPTSQAPEINIAEAEEQYTQHMLEGDGKAASALRLQINQALQEQAYARFTQESAAQQEQSKMTATVGQLLDQYPWLDTADGQEALDAIEGAVYIRMQRGMSREQATVESVNLIAPRFAPAGSPSRAGREGGASVDIRVQRANERGAADSMLQPAALQAGMGNRATPQKTDSSKMTDDEYMALPEAERKKLRGDQI